MAARRSIFAVLIVGLSLLAGCTPADPNLQPTYTCTPDDGSSPYACPKVQYDAKAKEAALYAEAEAVYRKYLAEDERIYRLGGVSEPTPVILETTTGQYQTDAMSIYGDLKTLGVRLVEGSLNVVWVRRAPDSVPGGMVAAVTSCVDGTGARLTDGKGGLEPGSVIQETAYLSRVDGLLKLTTAKSLVADKC